MHKKIVKRKYDDLPKIVNKNRAVAAPRTFKVPYGAEGSTCKKECCEGVLRATQWNRLLCSVCNYSELV